MVDRPGGCRVVVAHRGGAHHAGHRQAAREVVALGRTLSGRGRVLPVGRGRDRRDPSSTSTRPCGSSRTRSSARSTIAGRPESSRAWCGTPRSIPTGSRHRSAGSRCRTRRGSMWRDTSTCRVSGSVETEIIVSAKSIRRATWRLVADGVRLPRLELEARAIVFCRGFVRDADPWFGVDPIQCREGGNPHDSCARPCRAGDPSRRLARARRWRDLPRGFDLRLGRSDCQRRRRPVARRSNRDSAKCCDCRSR